MRKAFFRRHSVIRHAAAVATLACLGAVDAIAQSGAADGEWGVFGADEGATRYSPLDQIDAGNVADLEVAWRWSARDQGTPPPSGRTQISPLVINGVMYTTIGYQRNVVALDASTGEATWMHDTLGRIWGSTLVADGKIYVGTEDGELVILREGREVKELGVAGFPGPIYSSPVAANGRLYIQTPSHLYAFGKK